MTSGFCSGFMNVLTLGRHQREQKRRLKESFEGAEALIAEKEAAEAATTKQIELLRSSLNVQMTARRTALSTHNTRDEAYWKSKCQQSHKDIATQQAVLLGLQQQRQNMVAQLQGLRRAHEKIESASKDDAFQQLHQLLPGQKSITKYNDKQIRQHEKLNNINDDIDDYNANTTSLAQEGVDDTFDATAESEEDFTQFMMKQEMEEAREMEITMDDSRMNAIAGIHAGSGSGGSSSSSALRHGLSAGAGAGAGAGSPGGGVSSPRFANVASLDTT
jgi:hypothetical protein